MERWKKNDPSLRIGDSEEDAIVVSDDEEEVEASPSSGSSYQVPTLAEHIGPVTTGQRAVRSSPGYREAREYRRQEKSKAEEYEPVRGTRAARKTLGARAPGTSGNILGTLKALDQFASDVSTRHSLITFGM